MVAFVSMSSLDRGATKELRAIAARADQIALGDLDQIVSQFQAEIADPQLSTDCAVTLTSGSTNDLFQIPLLSACYAVPLLAHRAA